MKRMLYTLLALSFLGCDNDDKPADESVIIRNGEEGQSLNSQNDLDKYLDGTFARPYSIQILYHFLGREISRTYTYTPTKYNRAIESVNVFSYLFIEPYVKLTSKPFMKEHSFNTLILIGEPAFNPTDTKLMGLAATGIKVHLTDIDHLEASNICWLNDNILAIPYHEDAHTWRRAKLYTTDYEEVSTSDYRNDHWVNEWNLSTKNYLKTDFITVYSSFDHDEDLVELLTRYVVYYNASLDRGCTTTNRALDADGDGFGDALYSAWKAKFSNYGNTLTEYYTPYESTSIWEEVLKEVGRKIRPTETYTGKQKIEQKVAIMKRHLQEEWNINLDELRAKVRSRYPYIAGKTFDGVPIQRKDFIRLTR